MKRMHKEARSWQENFLRHPEGEFWAEQNASITQPNGDWRMED